MHKYFIGVLFVAICCFTACDSNRVFDEYKTLPENQWNKDSILSFTVKKMDTVKPYNLFINLRVNKDYNYNNLFLITTMNFPNGKTIKDTLEYEMAYPNGKLMGEGFGDIKENKLWYKKGVVFAEDGTYKFSIQQAMRKNGNVKGIKNLSGITEVGFRIEKTN